MRHAWLLGFILATSMLAGCTDAEDNAGSGPVDDPDPGGTDDPDPSPRARLVVALDARPQAGVVPADVDVSLSIASPNPATEPVPTGIEWSLQVIDRPLFERTGQTTSFSDTWRFEQRGTYTIEATVTADGFLTTTANETFTLDPQALQAHVDAPPNATRGDWFNLTGSASMGYTDEGYACAWSPADPDAIQLDDPEGCATQARWLKAGNQTVSFIADDGRTNASAPLTMEVLPLVPLSAPNGTPEAPHITDPGGEDAPILPRTDITAAWFASDVENLYVGLAIEDIPDDAETAATVYRVAFTHSWNATSAGSTEGFRVVASQEAVGDGGPAPMEFSIEAADGGEWSTVAALPDASVDRDNDIFWWPVPRSLLAAPLQDAVISGFVAEAGPSAGPENFQDVATGEGSYTLA